MLASEYAGRDPVMRDKRHHYFDIMITGLDFLENLCVGPHRENQERLVSTEIIAIIHRSVHAAILTMLRS